MNLYPYTPSTEAVKQVLKFVDAIDEPATTNDWQIERLGLDRLHFTLLVLKDERGTIQGYIAFSEIGNGVWTIEVSASLSGRAALVKGLFEDACQYAFRVLKAHKLVVPNPENHKGTKRFLKQKCRFVRCGYMKNYLIRANGTKIGVVLLSRDAEDA